ncbi:hypothetical protein LSHI6S_02609 [Leifsonia shinshuensis]
MWGGISSVSDGRSSVSDVPCRGCGTGVGRGSGAGRGSGERRGVGFRHRGRIDVTNKTPREEEIQKEQEAKDAEKERLERDEEERLR